jgi:hypothetical protein
VRDLLNAHGAQLAEWAGTLAAWIVTSVINGLLSYKPAGGFLNGFIDRISMIARKNSPHSVKPPLSPSKPPEICVPPGMPTARDPTIEITPTDDDENTPAY